MFPPVRKNGYSPEFSPPPEPKGVVKWMSYLSTSFEKFKEILYKRVRNELTPERVKLQKFWKGDEPTTFGFDRPIELRPGATDPTYFAIGKVLGEEFQREKNVLKLAIADINPLHRDHILWFFDVYRRDQFVVPMNQLDIAIREKRWENADAIFQNLSNKISQGSFIKWMNGHVKKIVGDEAVSRALKAYHPEFWRNSLEKMPYLGERS
jgi:hypothetical protein